MRRLLSIVLCACVFMLLSACGAGSETLLEDVQKEIGTVSSIAVCTESGAEIVIDKAEDIALLEAYIYREDHPSDKQHELFLFPETLPASAHGVDEQLVPLYLRRDGTIVARVQDAYRVYVTDADATTLWELLPANGG